MTISREKRPREIRIRPYPETHQQGHISIELDLLRGMSHGDFGIQIASDGRVWICIDGIAVIRFKPGVTYA